jgi:hypothetical protein
MFLVAPFLVDGVLEHAGEGGQVSADGGVGYPRRAAALDDLAHLGAIDLIEVERQEPGLELLERHGIAGGGPGRDLMAYVPFRPGRHDGLIGLPVVAVVGMGEESLSVGLDPDLSKCDIARS